MKVRDVTRNDESRNKGQESRGGGDKKRSTSDVDKIEAMTKKNIFLGLRKHIFYF